jgi:D-alanyl-D-alanine carboxypeptidase (penicillin-binding protein 5/6)
LPPVAAPARPAVQDFGFGGARADPDGGLGIGAPSAILVDLDLRQVLWSRDTHSRRAPASLTKLMTAVIALELAEMDREIEIPKEATEIEPSVRGLGAGERIAIREVLYGLFLDSGNDAAEALAQAIVPRSQFIRLMNARASRLGMKDSHFVNPTGLDDPEHYSSAYDLAILAGYARAQYPVLEQIAGTKQKAISPTAGHKAFASENYNRLLWSYPGATGMKTGYTEDAGRCVIATASRDGHHLVAVVLNSGGYFWDAQVLLDFGFRPARETSIRA